MNQDNTMTRDDKITLRWFVVALAGLLWGVVAVAKGHNFQALAGLLMLIVGFAFYLLYGDDDGNQKPKTRRRIILHLLGSTAFVLLGLLALAALALVLLGNADSLHKLIVIPGS